MDKDQIKQKHFKEYRQIGLLIAYYRKLNGYTQQQLAKSINISRTHLSNIEAPDAATSFSLEILFQISDALNVPVKKFFEFE